MESISEKEVIRYWLTSLVNEDDDLEVDAIESEPELYRELQRRQSGPTSIFANHSINWRLTELREEQFRSLRIVKGPPNTDWRLIAPDQELETAAHRFIEAESPAEFHPDVRDKIPEVLDMVEQYREDASMGRLILLKEGSQRPWIADGNHRAVAKYIHLIEGGEYTPQEAYLGRAI